MAKDGVEVKVSLEKAASDNLRKFAEEFHRVHKIRLETVSFDWIWGSEVINEVSISYTHTNTGD